MNLSKNRGMFLIAAFIILAVYNAIVFVIPFDRGAGFWAGYGFTMLSIILTTIVSFYALDREGLKSKFYGVPLISVVWRYLAIQLIVGFCQMIFQFIPYKYGIAVNVILLGACLIGLIAVEAGKDEIVRIDAKVREKIFYIKSLQVDVEGLVNKTSDEPVKKALKELADTIRYSDPMSSPQLAAIENKIEAKAADLAEAVEKSDGDAVKSFCNELQQLFAERNRKCKILK